MFDVFVGLGSTQVTTPVKHSFDTISIGCSSLYFMCWIHIWMSILCVHIRGYDSLDGISLVLRLF